MRFTNTVLIGRPVEEVFAFLADFERVPEWNHAIVETRKMGEGMGVGTRYRQTRKLPRLSKEIFEVVEFEPPVRIAVEGQFGPFHGRSSYRLDPTRSGTRVTNEVELQAAGVLRVLEPVAGGKVEAAVAGNLGKLKQLLERGP